jgi:hypothetical protein
MTCVREDRDRRPAPPRAGYRFGTLSLGLVLALFV